MYYIIVMYFLFINLYSLVLFMMLLYLSVLRRAINSLWLYVILMKEIKNIKITIYLLINDDSGTIIKGTVNNCNKYKWFYNNITYLVHLLIKSTILYQTEVSFLNFNFWIYLSIEYGTFLWRSKTKNKKKSKNLKTHFFR